MNWNKIKWSELKSNFILNLIIYGLNTNSTCIELNNTSLYNFSTDTPNFSKPIDNFTSDPMQIHYTRQIQTDKTPVTMEYVSITPHIEKNSSWLVWRTNWSVCSLGASNLPNRCLRSDRAFADPLLLQFRQFRAETHKYFHCRGETRKTSVQLRNESPVTTRVLSSLDMRACARIVDRWMWEVLWWSRSCLFRWSIGFFFEVSKMEDCSG